MTELGAASCLGEKEEIQVLRDRLARAERMYLSLTDRMDAAMTPQQAHEESSVEHPTGSGTVVAAGEYTGSTD